MVLKSTALENCDTSTTHHNALVQQNHFESTTMCAYLVENNHYDDVINVNNTLLLTLQRCTPQTLQTCAS